MRRSVDLGFSVVGVIEAQPGRRLQAYLSWIAKEYHGEMKYMARPDRIARRKDLNIILPGVRSIVCVGLDYGSMQVPKSIANDPSRGRVSNYAWAVDYHDLMVPRLELLADWLRRESGSEVAQRVYVDTGAILERDHGESAGLGFTGKNTMLINPRRGSWFFLGELLTIAELTPEARDKPMPSCGTCSNCLSACPTKAFPEPYLLDARRCISYLTIELKGSIPNEFRSLMGNWVYGCDECQIVCPFNRFALPSSETFRPANFDRVAPPLMELLSLDEAAFESKYFKSPIKRIKRRGLVRNACVAAGNWGDATAVKMLMPLLSDSEPLIREHAAWALGCIGGSESFSAVELALANETDDKVRAEMAHALS